MRTTTSFNFYCRSSKADKQGQSPVELSIVINGQRKFLNLPFKCSPKDFSLKKRPQYITQYIDTMRVVVSSILTDMAANGIPLTAERLREYIRTGGVKSYTIEDLFNDYLAILSKRVGISLTAVVYDKYIRVRDLFKAHINFSYECTAITPALIQNIQAEWNKTYKLSTTAGMLTKLKTIIKFGMDNGHIKINPFQGIKIEKGETDKEYLSEEELQKIADTDLDNPRLEKARDLLLFQAYGGGMAYCDMVRFNPDKLVECNGMYTYTDRRQKTGIEFTTILLPKAVEILKKYDWHIPTISNQRLNSYAKEIQQAASIKKSIHTHLMRKSYATLLLSHQVPITTISKCLGHSNCNITTKLYAHTQTTSMVNEIKQAFS